METRQELVLAERRAEMAVGSGRRDRLRFVAGRRDDRLAAGFTLVELLTVMIIIAILAALLLPAVNSVVRRARIARVVTEIKDLEAALANFKAKYGAYPPSYIKLYPPGQTWDPRSKAFIRRFWPQFDFTTCGGLSGIQSVVELDGAECLVFFLGGIPRDGGLEGFSKNPSRPFALGGSRDGPYYEFDTTRLEDFDNDGFPALKDSLPGQSSPYVYFSSYEGQGYRRVVVSGQWRNADNLRWMRYVYYQTFDRNDPRKSRPYNPRGFQIISPGADGKHGTGGLYDPNDPSSLGQEDKDNITNFSDGPLGG